MLAFLTIVDPLVGAEGAVATLYVEAVHPNSICFSVLKRFGKPANGAIPSTDGVTERLL